ncbi:MAG: hypothetical protein GX660_28410 [Clostridiaceae bacterium]|nr:hypothetical protein [Clostridiaceae bacterium]
MNTLIENLCKHGTVSFDFSEKGYTIIFEPHTNNSLPEQIQSTVLFVRNSPNEAVTALNQYITSNKHWSEYPDDFWVIDE